MSKFKYLSFKHDTIYFLGDSCLHHKLDILEIKSKRKPLTVRINFMHNSSTKMRTRQLANKLYN